jgi:hypothetical protein
MSKLAKIMLVLMVVNFVAAALFLTGLVNISNVPGLYVTFPLGATFYGLFLIAQVLEKEVAGFDQEQRRHQHPASGEEASASAKSIHGHERHVSARA